MEKDQARRKQKYETAGVSLGARAAGPSTVLQQSLLPSATDPGIWKVQWLLDWLIE
jgi:hypothetical protein